MGAECLRVAPPERDGSGTGEAQADVRGSGVGEPGAEGSARKKNLSGAGETGSSGVPGSDSRVVDSAELSVWGVVSGGLVSDAHGASGRRSRRDCGAPRGGGPVPPVGLLEVFQAAEAAAVPLEPQVRVSSLLRAPTQPEASGEMM